MSFKPYTASELLDFFDATNCHEDVSVVSDYLIQNRSDYTPGEFEMLKRLAFTYAELFTV